MTNPPPTALWLVLGASSAVARAVARQAASEGAAILLAGRDRADLDLTATDLQIRYGQSVTVVPLDIQDIASHQAFIASTMAYCRSLGDPVLNLFIAIGAMPNQEAMDADWSLLRQTIETNYLGVVSILWGFAPEFIRRRQGKIIVLGSVAGDRGRLKNYGYGSAKAGLHTFLEGYRARMFRLGVSVTTVKPGFLDTAMTWALPLRSPASPEACARHCLKAAARGIEETYFPAIWWVIMTIIRHIPARIMKRLNF